MTPFYSQEVAAMHPDEHIRDEAAHWAVRTGDPAFEDWDRFTSWLESDPDHARAYDEMMSQVDSATGMLIDYPVEEPLVAANDDEDTFHPLWRRGWFGPALAACLAGLVAAGVWQMRAADEVYVTPMGESMIVALGEGSTAELAGGTRLVIDGEDARSARLERGHALFRIRHDAGDPFRLVAAGDTLVDVGTIFDVRIGRERLDVAVAEGAVIVNPQAQNLRIDAGEGVVRSEGVYVITAVPPAEIGEWTDGRATFRDATLEEITLDLTRATGIAFSVQPGSEAMRLSGSIALGPVRSDPRTLEALLGVRARPVGDGWVLSLDS